MSRRFDYQRAARALVDAVLLGDEKSAEKHGISQRSLRRYRNRIEEDDKLAETVQEKLEAAYEKQDDIWLSQVPDALKANIKYLQDAAGYLGENNRYTPDMIHAVAGAAKILAQIEALREMLNARFGESGRARLGEDGEAVTAQFRELTD